jgi:hypothetical protein
MIIRLGKDAALSGNRGSYSMIWQPLTTTLNVSQQPPQSKLAQPNPNHLNVGSMNLNDSTSRVKYINRNIQINIFVCMCTLFVSLSLASTHSILLHKLVLEHPLAHIYFSFLCVCVTFHKTFIIFEKHQRCDMPR